MTIFNHLLKNLLSSNFYTLTKDLQDFFYYYASIAAYNLNDYKAAIQYCSKAIQKNPGNVDAYRYLGMSFEKVGLDRLAQNVFSQEKALKEIQKADKVVETEKNQQLFLYAIDAKGYFFRKQKEKEPINDED